MPEYSDTTPDTHGRTLLHSAHRAKSELTDQNGRYSVSIVMDYEIPVITITYQPSMLHPPVEIAHAYLQTKQGKAAPYIHQDVEASLYRSYTASIRAMLRNPEFAASPAFTHHQEDKANPLVKTLYIGVNPAGKELTANTGYFSFAQIFAPPKRYYEVLGYDPHRVLKAICAITHHKELLLGSGYQSPAHHFDTALDHAAKAGHLVHWKTMRAIKPPHTHALGAGFELSPECTDGIIEFPGRSSLAAEKKARGIGMQKPHPPEQPKRG